MAIDKSARKDEAQSRQMQLARPATVSGPFGFMRRLFEDLERLAGVRRPGGRGVYGEGPVIPDVEVMRHGDQLVVQVDLPGLAPDDVHVAIDRGAMTIEGERRSEHEDREGDVWVCERTYGRFQRVIPLPQEADPESAEARFENGVLQISIRAPQPEARGKRIEIKTEAPRRAAAH